MARSFSASDLKLLKALVVSSSLTDGLNFVEYMMLFYNMFDAVIQI